jgi:hypothetical protein
MTFTHHMNECASQLTNAIEGGIDYWAEGRNFKRVPKGEELSGFYNGCDIKPKDTGEGDPYPEGDPRNGWQTLTLDRVAEAIELILACDMIVDKRLVDTGIAQDIRANWADPEECRGDAETADCIIQVACFGEVVFG